MALLAWNLWNFWPGRQKRVSLPYSIFLTEVSAGNVPAVRIVGGEIQGAFKHPVAWEKGTAAASQSLQETGTAKDGYLAFRTAYPQVVGDASLMALLSQHHVLVEVAPPPGRWLAGRLSGGLPLFAFLLVLGWVGLETGILRGRRSRPGDEVPGVTFKDLAGLDEAREALREVVEFLRQQDEKGDLGVPASRGILLVGPAGVGKTTLARAVAGESGVPFFSRSASDFEGPAGVRELFKRARAASPAVVYLGGLEALERGPALRQLLAEMDGFGARQGILLGSAERTDSLDPALLRLGRFERVIWLGLPDRQGRQKILGLYTRALHLAADVDLGLLARTTSGLSGADLERLCREAGRTAAGKGREKVEMADFEEALDRILMGAGRAALLDEHERRAAAYHESGHALVAWLTPGAGPVGRVTLLPTPGRYDLDGEQCSYSQPDLLARLAVLLGGRAAEQVGLGEVSTGAEDDLIRATHLARRMVTRWGMGGLGLMALAPAEEATGPGRAYSEETAARVDQDVQRLLAESYEKDLRQLSEAKGQLDSLAKALLQDENLAQSALARILGARGQAPEVLAKPAETLTRSD